MPKAKAQNGKGGHGPSDSDDDGNNNNENDDDDDDDDDDSSNLFSWRRDPEEIFSDWTIVIIPPRCKDNLSATALLRRDEEENVEDEKNDEKPQELTMGRDGEIVGKTTTYHVHKFVVGVSPRGSQYFLCLFQSSKSTPVRQFLAESATSTSLIELQSSAAVAFPIMLDFMYFVHSTEVQASSATAVALRYLANYFEVPTLFDSVNQFIENDMDKDNLHIYLEEAILYQVPGRSHD